MLYTIGLHTRYVYVCTCMMSVSDHPACVSSLCGACDGRYDVCMRCCERSGLLGLWGCGPVSSPVIVPVRCLRAVKKVESSRVPQPDRDVCPGARLLKAGQRACSVRLLCVAWAR